jgi:hypothetical protein
VLSIWVLALYFSVQKTNRVTLKFYQWVSNDPSATDNDFAREPKDGEASIEQRFHDSKLPFKKHIRIAVDSLPATKTPRNHRPISFGGATNGAGFESGITLTNSYYSAYIRMPVDAEEKSARGLSVAIETALFGL